jgi:large subunit ribosomal protein L21
MFAVVRTGGKQYRVAAGDKIVVEKLAGEAGETITLGDILLAGRRRRAALDGRPHRLRRDHRAGEGDKVIVFKKRRRHNYRRKNGHRQQHTILRITAIGDQKAEDKPKAATAEQAPAAGAPAADARRCRRGFGQEAACQEGSGRPGRDRAAAPGTAQGRRRGKRDDRQPG